MKRRIEILFCAVIILTACSQDNRHMFRLVSPGESGVTFRNALTETVDFNIFNYMYFYNGGGVAVGDVNGDGLADIYFTANQEPNALYLNEGELRFRDITLASGVAGFEGWTTGVTMADVNGDGKLDIYVSNLGDHLIYKGKNQLFINEGNDANGVPVFKDRAAEFGLDLVGFSTQASFLDFDCDGDLDLFMLTHSLHENGTFGKATLRQTNHPLAGDRLLWNDDGRFIDITASSGIYNSVIGYGLGVVASDVNMDGWPDIYVGNDFHENDYLYINQGNGTFKEVLEEQMRHTSRYTMGVDFADFNNDGYPDLFAADMLPEDPVILKASAAEDAFDVYNFKINFGFNHQFARNTLQLNNQDGTFSEIALYSGVAATDWSWATLFADFDLDGHKDLFIANGISRRSNNLDYINFITVDTVQMKMKLDMTEKELAYIAKMPRIKIPNYLYINNGDSTFTNVAASMGLETPSYSNGAAYGDLDNDGDLDLVVNNIDDVAFIYENRTRTFSALSSAPTYLTVKLAGAGDNRFGIGARVMVYDSGQVQVLENMPTRGYQSSVDPSLVFGTRHRSVVDSVMVVWPGGRAQKLLDIRTNQTITLLESDADIEFDYNMFHRSSPLFNKAGDFPLNYRHQENRFVEFNREALIPHMMSAEGPASAVADINGDGREDIFLGGAKWKRGRIYVQTAKETFVEMSQPALDADSTFEDVSALFFDCDGDGDMDLFVVSGGNEFSGNSMYRSPRLYLNDGRGNYARSDGLPPVSLTGACAAAADFDLDGDLDLFVGARTTTWRYGVKPDSYLLRNDGGGNFSDVTTVLAPSLRQFAFVKSATWSDVDRDDDPDLVIAAEWSPITILINQGGALKPLELQSSGLENSHGWWNTIHAVDYDADGDVDFIAGNLGLNSKLKCSVKKPVRMFVSDFDNNDSTDQILSHFVGDREYPFHTRDELTKQMPFLKKRFLSYQKFAETDLAGMFSESALSGAVRYEAFTFESSIIENLGDLKFRVRPLPKAAQFSTLNAIATGDYDDDGILDFVIAGNFYPVNIQRGRYDASYGLLLKGDGKGWFKTVPAALSGLSIEGETRALQTLAVGKRQYLVAVCNNAGLQAFSIGRTDLSEQNKMLVRRGP